MYSVSNEYKAELQKNIFKFDLFGRLTGTGDFYASNILAGSLTINKQCSSGNKIIMGSTYASELKATFVDTNSIDIGATITLSEGMYVDDLDRYEYVPMGAYKVAEAVKTRSGIVVTAYDYMSKFNKKAALASVSGSVFEWLRYCCSMCNVTMAQTQAQIEALPNGTAQLTCYIPDGFECTYRDVVSYLAQIIGGFATMNRDGELLLVSYEPTAYPVAQIGANGRYSNESSFAMYTTNWDAVSYLNVSSGTDETVVVGTATSEETTFSLGFNPFMQNPADAAQIALTLLSVAESMTYVPFKIKVASGACYDLGDTLTQLGGLTPNPITSRYLITSITWTYNKGTALGGAGADVSVGSGGHSSSTQPTGGGGGGGGSFVALTPAQYAELPLAQKLDESKLYLISSASSEVHSVSQASSNVNVKIENSMHITSSENSSDVIWSGGDYIGCEIDIITAIDVTNVDEIKYDLVTGVCYGHNNQNVEEQTTVRFQCQIGVASSLPAVSNWMSDNMGLYQVYNTHKYTNTTYTEEQCTLDVSGITGTVYIVANCHGWNLTLSNIRYTEGGSSERYIKYKDTTYANYDEGGGGGALPDYSTTEHKTGRKWIDGKDTWERTFVLKENNVDQYSYNASEYVQVLPANIDWIRMVSLYEKRYTGYVDTMNSDMCVCVLNPSTRNIYFVANQSTDIVLTLEYTYAS